MNVVLFMTTCLFAMQPSYHLKHIGLSDYAIHAYLSLIQHHPVNGSQLSRLSGIPRSRIYDLLRILKEKGYAAELDRGLFAPLPPDELIKRLRSEHEADLTAFEALVNERRTQVNHDFIWSVKGYANILAKAVEMIRAAGEEIYVRLFPEEGDHLAPHLKKADEKGVQIKYISMFPSPHPHFRHQVVHPDYEHIEKQLGGRSFDLVVDRAEILGGLIERGREDEAVANWGKNRWFVIAERDSLRHDFFHYFLHKTYHLNEKLSPDEKKLYELILKDI